MKCSNCKSEIEDGAIFCNECGAEVNLLEKKPKDKKPPKKSGGLFKRGAAKKNPPEEKAEKTEKDKNKDKKKAFFKRLKIGIGLILAAVAAAFVITLILSLRTPEGEKLVSDIPLGRSLDIVQKETGATFMAYSDFDSVSRISAFDFIHESGNVDVGGLSLPGWAVLISRNSENMAVKAEYYDFTRLKSWKGEKVSGRFDEKSVEYGMTKKAVKKLLNLRPYSVIREIDDSITYIYRYYYKDPDTGDDRVSDLYVVFSDVDETVRDIRQSELDLADAYFPD